MNTLRRLGWIIPLVVGACSPVPSIAPSPSPLPSPTSIAAASPSPVPSPTAIASTSASPTPSAAPSQPSTAWEEVFASDTVSLGNVVLGPEGFIAAGCRTDESLNCVQRIVVTSPDGRAWTLSELEMANELGASRLRVVGDRLFAIGYADTESHGGAVVWTSLDGRSWSRVKSASLRGRAVRDVIETPKGTFAVGYIAPPSSDNTSGFVMWPVRADGSFGPVQDIDIGDPRLVSGALWAGEEFVAWGLRGGPWTGPTIVLASPDGRVWTTRARIPGPRATVVEDIVAAGDRLIAVGYEGRRFPLTPRAWISDDAGRSWTRAIVEGTDVAMGALELAGDRLIARGRESWGSNQRAVSWESANGKKWTLLPRDEDMPAVFGFSALTRATIDERTCVAGSFYDDPVRRGAIYCR